MLFIQKYRPSSWDEIVLDPKIRDIFTNYVTSKSLPNIILHGLAGTGKTSLVNLIKKEMNIADDLILNGSEQRGIDIIRDEIIPFCSTISISDSIKIIDIREADELTPNAQKALKDIIEESYDNVRFIFTTNNLFKILPEIRSRCTIFEIYPSEKKEVYKYIYDILVHKEAVLADSIDSKKKVVAYVDMFYPDIRKCIVGLDTYINNGKFIFDSAEAIDNIYENKLFFAIFKELIDVIENKDVQSRLIKSTKLFSLTTSLNEAELTTIYSYLFRTVDTTEVISNISKASFKLVTHDYLVKSNVVADKLLNLHALLINILTTLK